MNAFSARIFSGKTFSVETRSTKRASQRGALFVVCTALSFFLLVVSTPVLAKDCPADRIDETAIVEKVIDGDTLRLKDGRLVRLIGINTPELARKGRSAEKFAEQAKDALSLMLESSKLEGKTTIGLRFDAEKKDRHGRTLAHVYLHDGRSVESELLSAGYAAQIVVPPNTGNVTCYQLAEREARIAHVGVWNSLYRPVSVESMPRDTKGFRVMTGRVMEVAESKQSIWLNFPRRPGEARREGVAVRISRNDLGQFKKLRPEKLKNKKIIVRGWLYPYKKQLVMRVRHPVSLEVVPETWK